MITPSTNKHILSVFALFLWTVVVISEYVPTPRQTPLVRGLFRVDQHASLDASESGVPAVYGDLCQVAAGLVNQSRRLCPSVPSETPRPQVFLLIGDGGDGRS